MVIRLLCGALALISLHASFAVADWKTIEAPLSSAPNGWEDLGAAEDVDIRLFMAVLQNDQNLEAMATAASDPGGGSYGNFKSHTEIGDLFGNTTAAAVVASWVTQHEVKWIHTTPNKEFVEVLVSIAVANQMLNTTFHNYNWTGAGASPTLPAVPRTLQYKVPTTVADYLYFVGNAQSFISYSGKHSKVHPAESGLRRAGCKATASDYPLSITQTAAQCVVTPGVLQEVYGITESVVTDSKCTHGVFETQQQYYNPNDLGTYASAMPNVKTDQAAHIHAHGSNNPSKAGDEATLDVQVLTGVAQNAPTTFYSLAMNSQEVTRMLAQ